jgi:thioredoxin reductase
VLWDVIIVGGGPAGLSAALVLGRCRRKVLIIDAGQPRNRFASAGHGYLTRDGCPPLELLAIGRAELTPYGVECRDNVVVDAEPVENGFEVRLKDGGRLRSKKLLLATGVVDQLPPIPGVREFYGKSVYHCPYCDGWEARDLPIAVYGRGKPGAGLAASLKTWSADIVLCTDGPPRLGTEDRQKLARQGIPVRAEKIVRLEGAAGLLERVVFRSGDPLPRRSMFFSTGQVQRSPLAEKLGCRFNEKGTVRTNIQEATNIPGIYVAGDASKDVQFVVVAAAEGAKAAVAINRALQDAEGRR